MFTEMSVICQQKKLKLVRQKNVHQSVNMVNLDMHWENLFLTMMSVLYGNEYNFINISFFFLSITMKHMKLNVKF